MNGILKLKHCLNMRQHFTSLQEAETRCSSFESPELLSTHLRNLRSEPTCQNAQLWFMTVSEADITHTRPLPATNAMWWGAGL